VVREVGRVEDVGLLVDGEEVVEDGVEEEVVGGAAVEDWLLEDVVGGGATVLLLDDVDMEL
jgi:hypothetical protein